jgi:hypothetical protein
MSVSAGRLILLGTATVFAAVSVACDLVPTSEAQTIAPAHVQGGAWFVQSGCTSCHSISVYGVWNPSAMAPDLSIAVDDVPKRFGRSLEEFLREPTGTMAMVLSSRIPLTDRDRTVAIDKLKEANRLHHTAGAPMPSH